MKFWKTKTRNSNHQKLKSSETQIIRNSNHQKLKSSEIEIFRNLQCRARVTTCSWYRAPLEDVRRRPRAVAHSRPPSSLSLCPLFGAGASHRERVGHGPSRVPACRARVLRVQHAACLFFVSRAPIKQFTTKQTQQREREREIPTCDATKKKNKEVKTNFCCERTSGVYVYVCVCICVSSWRRRERGKGTEISHGQEAQIEEPRLKPYGLKKVTRSNSL